MEFHRIITCGVRGGLLAAAFALLLAATRPASAGSPCKAIPHVGGIDQSPTKSGDVGRCTKSLEVTPWLNPFDGHWCKGRKFSSWPNGPSNQAKQCMKFGRMTVYRGPPFGYSPVARTACNALHAGSSEAAMVAVSTKYLRSNMGGWKGQPRGACGKCMCIHIHGADQGFNPGLQREHAAKPLGITFLGKVGDRCAECEDDHIDVMLDRPLAYAPYSPSSPKDNEWAPWVNAREGYRVFKDPKCMRGCAGSPESVGAWTADWQFVPCSYTHAKCGALMRSKMGYKDARPPSMTDGVDSYTLRPMGQLRVGRGGGPGWMLRTPWGKPLPSKY